MPDWINDPQPPGELPPATGQDPEADGATALFLDRDDRDRGGRLPAAEPDASAPAAAGTGQPAAAPDPIPPATASTGAGALAVGDSADNVPDPDQAAPPNPGTADADQNPAVAALRGTLDDQAGATGLARSAVFDPERGTQSVAAFLRDHDEDDNRDDGGLPASPASADPTDEPVAAGSVKRDEINAALSDGAAAVDAPAIMPLDAPAPPEAAAPAQRTPTTDPDTGNPAPPTADASDHGGPAARSAGIGSDGVTDPPTESVTPAADPPAADRQPAGPPLFGPALAPAWTATVGLSAAVPGTGPASTHPAEADPAPVHQPPPPNTGDAPLPRLGLQSIQPLDPWISPAITDESAPPVVPPPAAADRLDDEGDEPFLFSSDVTRPTDGDHTTPSEPEQHQLVAGAPAAEQVTTQHPGAAEPVAAVAPTTPVSDQHPATGHPGGPCDDTAPLEPPRAGSALRQPVITDWYADLSAGPAPVADPALADDLAPAADLPHARRSEALVRAVGLLLSSARRRPWTVLVPAVAAAGITIVALQAATPLYLATATVRIAAGDDPGGLAAALAAETATLRSETLAAQTISSLALYGQPDFNPMLPDGAGAAPADAGSLPEAVYSAERAVVIDRFLDRLDVVSQAEAPILSVTATAADPATAARIADQHVAGFVKRRDAEFRAAATRAGQALQNRLHGLDARLSETRAAISTLRGQPRTSDRDGALVMREQTLSDLTAMRQALLAERQTAETGSSQPAVHMLSRAALPTEPGFPPLIWPPIAAVVAGLLFGLLLAAARGTEWRARMMPMARKNHLWNRIRDLYN